MALMMSGCPLCLFVSTSHVQIMWFFGNTARNFLQHNSSVTHPNIASLSLILPHFFPVISCTEFFFQVGTGHGWKPDSIYCLGRRGEKDRMTLERHKLPPYLLIVYNDSVIFAMAVHLHSLDFSPCHQSNIQQPTEQMES